MDNIFNILVRVDKQNPFKERKFVNKKKIYIL